MGVPEEHDEGLEGLEALISTRRAVHALAEHVLAAARYAAVGRIGLRVVAGGIGTPPFPTDGSGGEREIRLVGGREVVEVVVHDGDGERRAPVTTLAAAAHLAGIEPGGPAAVYGLVTPCRPDQPLALDPAAFHVLAEWLSLGESALGRLVELAGEHGAEAAPVTLWPEHLDVATTVEEVNYGASAGDDDHPGPYLYVGPWAARRGPFWNAPFGALLGADAVDDVDGASGFFVEGRARAGEDPLA